MEGQEVDIIVILFGTIGMLLLAIALILFAILYKRRITAKKMELIEIEQRYQIELLRSTIEAKEKEQYRIARELHDEVGSSLTAIKLHLNKYKLEETAKREIGENIRSVVLKVREISNELHPAVLEELGLRNAIRNLSRKLDEQTNLTFNYHCSTGEQTSIPKDVELSLYRVIQELFNNIVKHAEATQVNVVYEESDQSITISVEDDGKGFVRTAKHLSKGTLGLKNIDSRIQQIGAELNYEENREKGSKVTITQHL
ncbi:MAG: histidine kinase [Flavobacteriales bacterium]|jgi:signal transduction histidine kinase|nr:histidine kinase [Flavobacteriales bacterium]